MEFTDVTYIPLEGGKAQSLPDELSSQIVSIVRNGQMGGGVRGDSMLGYTCESDARHIAVMLERDGRKPEDFSIRGDGAEYALGIRGDAAPAYGALAMARQLEFIYKEVLTEPIPPRNGMSMFRRDTTVPAGARSHTVRRFMQEGEAKIYRGTSDDVPTVSVSQDEERFPVRHIVTSFRSELFQSQSSAYANIPEQRLKMRAARLVIEQYMNRLIWTGSIVHNLYGALNYPYGQVRVPMVTINGDSSPTDIINTINDVLDFPEEESDQAFAPNRVSMGTDVYNYLAKTRIGSVNDTTILQFLKTAHPEIKVWAKANELRQSGPSSTSGFLAYDDSPLGITYVVPQGITPLPLQLSGFAQVRYVYASYGGVVQRNSGSNILAWFDAS